MRVGNTRGSDHSWIGPKCNLAKVHMACLCLGWRWLILKILKSKAIANCKDEGTLGIVEREREREYILVLDLIRYYLELKERI